MLFRSTYVMQVHIFGAASSPCIANSTLRRVADDNAEEYSSRVVTAVKKNFYADDALPSENDEHSAIRLAHDMVELLAPGGFNLTTFTSNSKRLLSAVPIDTRSKPDFAFVAAKQLILNSQTLIHYDHTLPLFLSCDASSYGAGAALSHQSDGQFRPVAFASCTLTPAQQNYSQLEKEAFSIIFGLKRFRQYLYGRSFTIFN